MTNRIKNSVRLEGFLNENPKINETKGGKPYVNFAISTRNSYKKDGKWHQNKPQYHFPVAFGLKVVEQAEQFAKGDLVVIQAELESFASTDSSGKKTYRTSVVATSIEKLERSASTNKPSEKRDKAQNNLSRVLKAVKNSQ